jgi:hypothetical protein
LIANQPKIAQAIEKKAWKAKPTGKKPNTKDASSHHQKSWWTKKSNKKRIQKKFLPTG